MNKLLVLLLFPLISLCQNTAKKTFYFDQYIARKVSYNSEIKTMHSFTNSKDSTYQLMVDNGIIKAALLFTEGKTSNLTYFFDFDFTFFNYKQLSKLNYKHKTEFEKSKTEDFDGLFETFEHSFDTITNNIVINRKYYKDKNKKKIFLNYTNIYSNKRKIFTHIDVKQKEDIFKKHNFKIPDDYFLISTVSYDKGKVNSETNFAYEEKIDFNFEVKE